MDLVLRQKFSTTLLVDGPLLRIFYKVLVLLALVPVLASAVTSSSGSGSGGSTLSDSSLTNYHEIDDGSHVEVSRSVEPQVLARLESKFLSLFGMPRRPHKRSKPLKVPKYLIDLYNAQSENELGTSNLNLPGRHTRTANTVRTFYHLDDSEVRWGHRVKFDLSSIPDKEKVTGAELRLIFSKNTQDTHPVLLQSDKVSSGSNSGDGSEFSQVSSSDNDYDRVHVLVNDVIKPPTENGNEPIMFPIDSKLIDLRKRRNDSFWITLDVFPAVSRWMTSPKGNHGVVIQVVHPNGQVMSQATSQHIRVRRQTSDNAQSATENDPVLFTYSDDGVNKKQRGATALSRAYRAANGGGGSGGGNGNKKRKNHRKNRKRNLCSRHKMFVDFTDVGWNDWIVAPPGYHAYHCSGECPFPMAEHLNATNHAVIQALVNSMNPQMVPPPCCVPTKYSSLSLLYTDSSDKIVLKNYNEMVVDACGCS